MFEAIKANLFKGSHAAICDWRTFPWHRDDKGKIQTHKQASSQALAIDVFGTIKVSKERDRILGALALKCGVPADGPWTLKLEWTDPDRLLGEPRPTQVDAIAFGRRAVLVIECKFTEGGGSCSQPNKIRKGANAGLRQCSGHYTLQTNPVDGHKARCALAGKGIGYWENIPNIFGLDAGQDHHPCPFRGPDYQWMRNVVLAHALSSARGVPGAVMAAYAEGSTFPTAKKVRAGGLGLPAASGAKLVTPMAYQSIVVLAKSLADQPSEWDALAAWVERKIKAVEAAQSSSRTPPDRTSSRDDREEAVRDRVTERVEMPKPPAPDEWDQLVLKMGTLTLATGTLELAIIQMVCRILAQSEDEVGIRDNNLWCQKFIEVAPASWSDDERKDLAKRLKKIRALYLRRNRMIHAALGVAGDGSIHGVPTGSVIDLRTYGIGFTKRKGNTFTIGIIGKRVHLHDIDRLTKEIHEARVGLVPFMELVDRIKHPAKPFPMPKVGKRL